MINFEDMERNEIYECQIPEPTDPNEGDTVSLSIGKGLNKEYMTFDSRTRILSLDTSKIRVSDAGFKNVEFILKDSYGAQVSKKVIFRIMEAY